MNKLLRAVSAAVAAAAVAVSLTSCGKAYNYDLSKYVTLGQYKGVSVSASEIDEAVESQLNSLLESKSESKDITDRAAKDGDKVNIDYVGTINGEAFDGGTASGDEITLGSGAMIDGFESGIVGMTTGQTKTVTCTFPDAYDNADLAGKTADFAITLNTITETVLPELTDEFIAGLDNGYSTVDDYKAYLRDAYKSNYAWSQVVSGSTVIKYPDKEVKTYYNNMVNYYKQLAANYGVTLDEYIANYAGSTTDVLLSYILSYAKSNAKQMMVMHSIADAEGIKVDDASYKTRGEELAKSSGYDTLKDYEKAAGKDGVKESVLSAMVQDFVADNAVEG